MTKQAMKEALKNKLATNPQWALALAGSFTHTAMTVEDDIMVPTSEEMAEEEAENMAYQRGEI